MNLLKMNGMAVKMDVFLRPNFSISAPPITPPSNAPSGIKLPIHDACVRKKTKSLASFAFLVFFSFKM